MRATIAGRFAGLVLLSGLGGCAATSVEATWLSPQFAGRQIEGPVLVVAVARDQTVRRTYEDEMAARLPARGLAVVRSYEQVPGALTAEAHDRLVSLARSVDARYMLSTALIGQEVEQVVTHEPIGPVAGGYRGWYAPAWGYAYAEVRTYQVYVAQTALTAVADDRVEWTARTRTTQPGDLVGETKAFVGVIVEALDAARLLRPAR